MYAKAAEDEEVTKWARAEAAKSVVDAMYLKAAAMIKKNLDKLLDQLEKLEIQRTDKDENKTIALGTSKLNYLDPR